MTRQTFLGFLAAVAEEFESSMSFVKMVEGNVVTLTLVWRVFLELAVEFSLYCKTYQNPPKLSYLEFGGLTLPKPSFVFQTPFPNEALISVLHVPDMY